MEFYACYLIYFLISVLNWSHSESISDQNDLFSLDYQWFTGKLMKLLIRLFDSFNLKFSKKIAILTFALI